jgi:hypothetical protein
MNSDDTLLEALKWVALRGASVLPVAYGDKAPDFEALAKSGYAALDGRGIWKPLQSRPPMSSSLAAWFGSGEERNIAVVTGGYGGLVCIDFDTFGMFGVWDTWARAQGGIAAEVAASTYKVATRRGVHLWVRVAQPVASSSIPGLVDVKGLGGYALVPPSLHPSGVPYTAFDPDAPIIECERLAEVFPFAPEAQKKAAPVAPRAGGDIGGQTPLSAGGGIFARIKATGYGCADLLGIDLAGRGSVSIRCPLHDDCHPSMTVYSNGRCFCHRGCTGIRGYDVVDLYAALHGVSLNRAAAELAQSLGIETRGDVEGQR